MNGPQPAIAPDSAKRNPTIAPAWPRPKKSPTIAGKSVEIAPYEYPKTSASPKSRGRPRPARRKPRKPTAWSAIATPTAGLRPIRSETAPMTRRPATAPMPTVETTQAPVSAECPRSRVNGMRWTSGMKTGIHVAVNVAPSIQNAGVRIAPHHLSHEVHEDEDPDAEHDVCRPPADRGHQELGQRRQREGADARAARGEADGETAPGDEPLHDRRVARHVRRAHAERSHEAVENVRLPQLGDERH